MLGNRSLSSLGYQIQAVAIGWNAYQLTRSPMTLGLIGLAQFLPMLALVFVSGQVADRFDRRRVVVVCQAVEALRGLGLALGTLEHRLTPGPYLWRVIPVRCCTRGFADSDFCRGGLRWTTRRFLRSWVSLAR